MQFQLLGQLEVRGEGGTIDLGSPKQRAVLAVLLVHANEIVSTDKIIELVWGEKAPRTAAHSVQIYVSELRKSLGAGAAEDVIETRPPGYAIKVAPDSIDATRFERLVRDGLTSIRSADVAYGRVQLEEALNCWNGEPLSEFVYDDFAQGYIRSLTELRLDALEALARLELDEGRFDEARETARTAIEVDPLREVPREVMMLALYRTGRQTEALRHYAAYHQLLGDQMGIEPSNEMRELEERILLQDPTLQLKRQVETDGNPYRGLRAFSEDDADVYFGRESLIAEVLERLEEQPGFVSIVGPSGSGKSSVARAGVTPILRDRGETVVVLQPGSRPLWELAGALDRAGLGPRASLLRKIESDDSPLVDVVTKPVVLVID
ncbi:MAG TPA: BTAD domain-containing putative transcriptional regulator, partial [Acidimicrobiia bacterium]|nr:BTAD domain-containing putative transcriptional regulator [Acidimicrobiia bacterium]